MRHPPNERSARRRRLQQVTQARAAFNRKRQKCKLTFDQLAARYASFVPFFEIGREARITKTRVEFLFTHLFAPLFGFPQGNQRKAIRADKLAELRQKKLRRVPPGSKVEQIYNAARRHNLEVQVLHCIEHRNRLRRVRRRNIMINGRVCSARVLGPGSLTVTFTRKALHGIKFLVICQSAERSAFYIVPRSVALRLLGNYERRAVFLGHLDDYKGAWDLLAA